MYPGGGDVGHEAEGSRARSCRVVHGCGEELVQSSPNTEEKESDFGDRVFGGPQVWLGTSKQRPGCQRVGFARWPTTSLPGPARLSICIALGSEALLPPGILVGSAFPSLTASLGVRAGSWL